MVFKADNDNLMANSLAQYLFNTDIFDSIIITDLSISKGYKCPKKLSEANIDEIKYWVDSINIHADLLSDVDQERI